MARLHRVEVAVADSPAIITLYHMSAEDAESPEGLAHIRQVLERRGLGGREFSVGVPEYDLPKRTVPHIYTKGRREAVDFVF